MRPAATCACTRARGRPRTATLSGRCASSAIPIRAARRETRTPGRAERTSADSCTCGEGWPGCSVMAFDEERGDARIRDTESDGRDDRDSALRGDTGLREEAEALDAYSRAVIAV